MTLSPTLRAGLFAGAGAILAVVMGFMIANGAFFWPGLALGGLTALLVVSVQPLPLSTVVLGGAMVGYVVGNRGFAQLSLLGNFPLLPGEFTLAVGGCALLLHCALQRALPFRRDALNFTILAWMIDGTIRFAFDFRLYGVLALRDYALVYYAAFFFLAQWAAADPAAARFLRRCFLSAVGLLLIIHPVYSAFPDFFLNTITLRGVPLIFFKDDLVGNFLAVGSLLFFVQFERTRRPAWVAVSLLCAGLMVTTGSRSSMVGLALGAGWLALAGRRRLAYTLAASTGFAVLGFAIVANFANRDLRRTPLWAVYERVLSVADPLGQRTYEADVLSKGDNNVFRLVWWQAAIDETLESDRWFGLGFGHDLAARFLREYYPEGGDDFNARSPHNVLVTVFARMGFVGSALFAAILVALAARTWSALRSAERALTAGPWWCAVWIIFAGACFGIVLEGPMGAVVFWTLLGLASAAPLEQENAAPTEAAAALPTAEASASPAGSHS
jgi:hypothetical protein